MLKKILETLYCVPKIGVEYTPESELFGAGGIEVHDEALTIYTKIIGEDVYGLLVSLSENQKDCFMPLTLIPEIFGDYEKEGVIHCEPKEGNFPLQNCPGLHTGRYSGMPRSLGHCNWHLYGDDNPYHTHIFKSLDGETLDDLKEEDIKCVLGSYRKMPDRFRLFKGVCKFIHEKLTDECDWGSELLSPDDMITEEEIEKIVKLYEIRKERFINDLENHAQNALIEVLLFCFISELMKRYFLPKIRYHVNFPHKNEIFDIFEKIIPLMLLSYRLYLSINTFRSSVHLIILHLFYLSTDLLSSKNLKGQLVLDFNFVNFLFVIVNVISSEINREQLAKLMGFEIGQLGARNLMHLATKLASILISFLPKLKAEDKSENVKTEVIKNEFDNLRRRRINMSF